MDIGISVSMRGNRPSGGFNLLSPSPDLFLSPAGPFFSDAGTTQITSGGVHQWNNLGTVASLNATAANGSQRPTLGISGGYLCVTGDGLDDFLTCGSGAPTWLNGATFTIFAAVKLNTLSGSDRYFAGTLVNGSSATSSALQVGWNTTTAVRCAQFGDDASFSYTTLGAWEVHTIQRSGPGSSYRVNGVSVGTSGNPANALNSIHPFRLFRSYTDAGSPSPCSIACIWVKAATVTNTERANLETGIGALVGVTI